MGENGENNSNNSREISSGNSEEEEGEGGGGDSRNPIKGGDNKDNSNSGDIIIKLVGQDEKAVAMKVKKTSKLGSVFEQYRKANNLPVMPHFIHNGIRLSASLTPAQLRFRNREQIDVFSIAQGGGGGGRG